MATDDQQILVVGTAPAPASWLVPGNGQVTPRTVFAHYDGTGAGSAFMPALKVISDGGETIGVYPCALSVAAGGSADVSWFPGLVGIPSSKIAVVGARIEMHANQNVSSSTNTDLTYDTVAFDTGGMANLAADNRKLNVNTPGLYLVICERAWPYNNAGRRLVGITQNQLYASGGVLVGNNAQPAIWAANVGAGGQTTNSTTSLLKAAAGDFFATGANQDSGSTLTTGGGSGEFFSAILLGTV